MKLNVGILVSAILCCFQLTVAVPTPRGDEYFAIKESHPPLISRSVTSSPSLTDSTIIKRSLAVSDDVSSAAIQSINKRIIDGEDATNTRSLGGHQARQDQLIEKREPKPWNLQDPRLNFDAKPGYKCRKPPCRREDAAREEEELEKREPLDHKKDHHNGDPTHPRMKRDIAADLVDSVEKRNPAPYERFRAYADLFGYASRTPDKLHPGGKKGGHGRRGLAEDVQVASGDPEDPLTRRDPAPWTKSFIHSYALGQKHPKGAHGWVWEDGKWVPLAGHHSTGGHHPTGGHHRNP